MHRIFERWRKHNNGEVPQSHTRNNRNITAQNVARRMAAQKLRQVLSGKMRDRELNAMNRLMSHRFHHIEVKGTTFQIDDFHTRAMSTILEFGQQRSLELVDLVKKEGKKILDAADTNRDSDIIRNAKVNLIENVEILSLAIEKPAWFFETTINSLSELRQNITKLKQMRFKNKTALISVLDEKLESGHQIAIEFAHTLIPRTRV